MSDKHTLIDVLVLGPGRNGTSRRTFVCSCGERFTSGKLAGPNAVEILLVAFLAHRSPRVRDFAEGDVVVVIDEGHRHFDRLGTVRLLGDKTVFVDFTTGCLSDNNSDLNELMRRDQLAPWGGP